MHCVLAVTVLVIGSVILNTIKRAEGATPTITD